ncbi:hypothetical protein BH23PLA1_BH23PLA1_04610 [soil metagenome]
MERSPQITKVLLTALGGLILTVSVLGQQSAPRQAQQGSQDLKAREAPFTFGVIVKVEKPSEGEYCLTINTAAPWNDFVRTNSLTVEQAKAGKFGEEGSITTEGQPESEDTILKVVVGPDTTVTRRFRAADDEVSLGASTPEGALKIDTDPESKTLAGSDPSRQKSDPIPAKELKLDQFVRVEYRGEEEEAQARSVIVLVPIADPGAGRSDK